MKNIFVFSIFILSMYLLLFTCSCKKTNKNAQAGPYIPNISYPKILYLIDSNYNDTNFYFYNSEGNLIKRTFTNMYVDVLYNNNKVDVNIYENNINTYKYEYFLNSYGLATKCITYDLTNKKTNIDKYLPFKNIKKSKSIIDTSYYNYDIYGYLVSAIYGTQTYSYTYTNGNLTNEISPYDTTTYQYYEGKLNTIGNSNFGVSFLGKQSKNLRKTIKTNQIENYFYEFDNKERVIKETYKSTYSNQTNYYKYVD